MVATNPWNVVCDISEHVQYKREAKNRTKCSRVTLTSTNRLRGRLLLIAACYEGHRITSPGVRSATVYAVLLASHQCGLTSTCIRSRVDTTTQAVLTTQTELDHREEVR